MTPLLILNQYVCVGWYMVDCVLSRLRVVILLLFWYFLVRYTGPALAQLGVPPEAIKVVAQELVCRPCSYSRYIQYCLSYGNMNSMVPRYIGSNMVHVLTQEIQQQCMASCFVQDLVQFSEICTNQWGTPVHIGITVYLFCIGLRIVPRNMHELVGHPCSYRNYSVSGTVFCIGLSIVQRNMHELVGTPVHVGIIVYLVLCFVQELVQFSEICTNQWGALVHIGITVYLVLCFVQELVQFSEICTNQCGAPVHIGIIVYLVLCFVQELVQFSEMCTNQCGTPVHIGIIVYLVLCFVYQVGISIVQRNMHELVGHPCSYRNYSVSVLYRTSYSSAKYARISGAPLFIQELQCIWYCVLYRNQYSSAKYEQISVAPLFKQEL